MNHLMIFAWLAGSRGVENTDCLAGHDPHITSPQRWPRWTSRTINPAALALVSASATSFFGCRPALTIAILQGGPRR